MGCCTSRICIIEPFERIRLNPNVPGVPEGNTSQTTKAVQIEKQGQGPDNTEVLVGGARHLYNQHGQLRPARAEKSCIVCSVFKYPPQTVYELNQALEPRLKPRVYHAHPESTTGAPPKPSAPPAPVPLYPGISKRNITSPLSPSSIVPPIADLVERRLRIIRQEEDRARRSHVGRCRSFIDRCKNRGRPSPCEPTAGPSRLTVPGRRVCISAGPRPNTNEKTRKSGKKAKNGPKNKNKNKNKNKSKRSRANNKNVN